MTAARWQMLAAVADLISRRTCPHCRRELSVILSSDGWVIVCACGRTPLMYPLSKYLPPLEADTPPSSR